MEVSGEYTFDAPREMVWKVLNDPEVLSSVMPGGQGFEEVGENDYTGVLDVKVGPVQGKFKGTIKFSNIMEPESYTMDIDGKGAPGFVKASGSMKLTDRGEKTFMEYSAEARIGGRIATIGHRLLNASAKSIIRQSLDGLNEILLLQQAPAGSLESDAAIAYTPPSQARVSFNLAKDVAGDLVPAENRPYILAIAVILVVLILCRLSRPSNKSE